MVRQGWDFSCDCVICSVPALAFLGILSQLEVAGLCPLPVHQLLCLHSRLVARQHCTSVMADISILQ